MHYTPKGICAVGIDFEVEDGKVKDVKFTGGTYSITSSLDAIEANDSIRICGGNMTIDSRPGEGTKIVLRIPDKEMKII